MSTAPVWAILLASAISAIVGLLSVYFVNRGNEHRLYKQLDHDRSEKAAERKTALRRELYLEAIAESSTVISHIMMIKDRDTEPKNPGKGVVKFMHLANKVKLVSEQATAQEVTKLMTLTSQFLFSTLSKTAPIRLRNGGIRVIVTQLTNFQREIRSLEKQIRVLEEDKNWNELNTVLMERSKTAAIIAEMESHLERAEIDRRDANIGITMALFRDLEEINKVQINLLMLMRRELGIESDENLQAFFLEQAESFKRNLEHQFIKASKESN